MDLAVGGIQVSPSCVGCLHGKQIEAPYHTSRTPQASVPPQLVHSDMCGRITPNITGGNSYYVTFTDDCTRKVWAFGLRYKSEVFRVFTAWKVVVENEYGFRLQCLRSDNGGEFVSKQMDVFCASSGITHQCFLPHSP